MAILASAWMRVARPRTVALGFSVVATLIVAQNVRPAVQLPYDKTSPVFYDNDWTNDYADWYLMALATMGEIRYVGISTSSSVSPYNRYMTDADLDHEVRARAEIVERARGSGFENVPTPLEGARGHLVKPSSGVIEETQPLDSPGTREIVSNARQATSEQPLVVVAGGPATAVASAYLLDNSIADRVVVAIVDGYADGMRTYNGWADGWAATIILQRLRVVLFPVLPAKQYARLSKEWIRTNLPESEARAYMLDAELDVVNGEDGDADGMAAVSIVEPRYVRRLTRAAFSGWVERDGHEVPLLKEDSAGRVLVAARLDGTVATEAYERALRTVASCHDDVGRSTASACPQARSSIR